HIIGGYSATDCKNHLIGGITSGAIAGAHVGAIAGGLTCVGGMLFNGK
ncbi:bacteriocin, partial [Streptococcus pyogenes]